MRQLLIRSIALTTLLLLPTGARSQTVQEKTLNVIWREGAGGEVGFIPGDQLLNAAKLIPSTESGRAMARAAREGLHAIRRQSGRSPACSPPPHPEVFYDGPTAQPRSIDEIVSDSEVALVGVVDEVVAGWSLTDIRVKSLVQLTVETVLRGEAIQPGTHFSYLQDSGKLQIDGVNICSLNYQGFADANVGDRVLVIGSLGSHNRDYLVRRYVFPVRNGVVVPQPYSLVESTPVDLESIGTPVIDN